MLGSSSTAVSAFGSVHSFFHSTGFVVARNVVLLLVAVFWLGLAYWVNRDARRRVDDGWLVATATLLGLVPFVGPLVYLLFRPPETLAEVQTRNVEVRALEGRLARAQLACPVCRSDVESSYLVCPVCTTQLRTPCARCHAPLEPLWQACPYCAAPIGATVETLGPQPLSGDAATVDLDAALTAEAATNGNDGGLAPARRSAAS